MSNSTVTSLSGRIARAREVFPDAASNGAGTGNVVCLDAARRARRPYPEPHWSALDEYMFDSMVEDGHAPALAARMVNDHLADKERARSMPDPLRFLARQAVMRMREYQCGAMDQA